MTTLTATPTIVDRLLRTRTRFMSTLENGELRATARALFATTLIAAAIFGACIGNYRGGLQTLFAAIKFPIVLLLTAALTVPALSGVKSALGYRTTLGRDTTLVLSALALASLLMAAGAPVLFLCMEQHASYHTTILLVVAIGGTGGLAGLSVLAAGLRELAVTHRLTLLGVTLAVFSLCGSQLAWMMRPFLLRPAANAPVFLRAPEGSFFDSVSRSYDSARGIYEAPYSYSE